MKSPLALIVAGAVLAAGTCVFAAGTDNPTTKSPAGDRDIDAGSGLDKAVRMAGGQSSTEPTSTGQSATRTTPAATPTPAPAPAQTEAPPQAGPVAVAGPATTPNSSAAATATPGASTPVTVGLTPAALDMPDIPQSAQEGLTQIGGFDRVFEDTPIETVARQLAPQLGRPINLGLYGTYRVTGRWVNTTPLNILRQIGAKYGLTIRETPFAIVIEDGGREIPVATASVKQKKPSAATSALPSSLFSDNLVVEVQPASASALETIEKSLSKEEARVLRERDALIRDAK